MLAEEAARILSSSSVEAGSLIDVQAESAAARRAQPSADGPGPLRDLLIRDPMRSVPRARAPVLFAAECGARWTARDARQPRRSPGASLKGNGRVRGQGRGLRASACRAAGLRVAREIGRASCRERV